MHGHHLIMQCSERVCCDQVREDDLTVLVGEAATFVEKERARASKRARRHRDGRPRSGSAHLLADHPLLAFADLIYSRFQNSKHGMLPKAHKVQTLLS